MMLILPKEGLAGPADNARHSKPVLMAAASLSLSLKPLATGQDGSPILTLRGQACSTDHRQARSSECGHPARASSHSLCGWEGHKGPSGVWSAGIWGEHGIPRLSMPLVCVLACSVRV